MDRYRHVCGCDHWSGLRYVEIEADFTPEGVTVVFFTRGEVQSEGLILRFLQFSTTVGPHGSQFSLSFIKDHLDFSNGSSLLDCTLQSVLLALKHRASVIDHTDWHSTWRLCGNRRDFTDSVFIYTGRLLEVTKHLETCLTASVLTVDGDIQVCTTLVVIFNIVIVVAEDRCAPFSHFVNRPHDCLGSFILVVHSYCLFHIKLHALTLTRSAGG